ncbi:chemotaxis protein CheW [Anaeromyxobacter sp. PSR-1]|uniref:chemotaxis protein CheW n=1 Tax=unclassified Anaeromyxobacter TaxID=2620896 RepID=UPI0005E1A405|nr:chemotaxis protein CheW [Anaeromyxobacter sp. PSR-1]GAO01166.1 cheW-like domain protein [Anaeromyxobacter sp. PSR-1]
MSASSPRIHGSDVDEILARRAERARAAPAADRSEVALPVAEFGLGAERYAIPLASLRAVLPLRLVTPIPRAPAHVIGLLRFQGQLVTAHSLMALLGVKGWRQDCAVLLVLERDDGRRVAIDCEHVPRIDALPQRAVDQARARGAGPVHEVTAEGLRPVALLDVAALLARGAEASHG